MKTRHIGALVLIAGVAAMAGSGCPPTMTTASRDPLPTARPTNTPDNLTRWPKTNLTFFINNFTTKNTEAKQVQLITDAFNRWGAVTPLNFARVMTRTGADFVVGFGTGTHCELYVSSMLSCPADGAFSADTLAHAYFPVGPNMGQCHMNDAQDWSNDRLFFSTLVHELGHGLGLEHLPEMTAVMFASDNGQSGDLQAPDIAAIQRLYGSRDGSVRPTQPGAPRMTDVGLARTLPTTTGTDTDGDGIDDATEKYVYGTNPLVADTDGDGLGDGVEIVLGLQPTDSDTDDDGVSDGDELDGDGNAFIPDRGYTGDVTAFVGHYVGADSLGTPIDFTVAADGEVTGKLALTMYGFSEDFELIGHAGEDGKMELVSYDYFFDYEGTIVGAAVANGTFNTEANTSGTWTAAKDAKGKIPDSAAGAFTINGEGQTVPTHRTDLGAYAK